MKIPLLGLVLSARTAKILAVGYLVKSALLGLLWLTAPDLPTRARAEVRQAWERLTSDTR
jgi:hypothetical protein